MGVIFYHIEVDHYFIHLTYLYIQICTYQIPQHGQDAIQGHLFKLCLIGLKSEFSFSYTGCQIKVKVPSLSNYLPVAFGRIVVTYIM